MFRINYILKRPDKCFPWGDEPQHLHWFGLTDGLLWIDAGDSVIYEYPEPHPDCSGEPVIYNDYQLSRFIEDVLELTPVISESVPKSLFDVAETLSDDLQAWESMYIDKSDEEFDRFYDELYLPLSEWFYDRFLSSGHLVCGPSIGFISSFTADMDKQVEDVVRNGIPGVYVDTYVLVRENAQRKDTFEHQLRILNSGAYEETDWNKIFDLYDLMRKELGRV